MEQINARRYFIRIEPVRGWLTLGLQELWEFKSLLLILAMREVRLRYNQTFLGIVWVALQPLAAAVVFAVLFGRLARLMPDDQPILLYALGGLLPWMFHASAVQRASMSFIQDARLISKVYFPRIILPLAQVFSVIIDYVVGLGVLILLGHIFDWPTGWRYSVLPVILILSTILASGLGILWGALSVFYRDFIHILPFFLQIWMYSSPIVFSQELIPERWRGAYAILNPMVGIIESLRWVFWGKGGFPFFEFGVSVIFSGIMFLAGALILRRVERQFSDVI